MRALVAGSLQSNTLDSVVGNYAALSSAILHRAMSISLCIYYLFLYPPLLLFRSHHRSCVMNGCAHRTLENVEKC